MEDNIDTSKEYRIKELCELLDIKYNKKNPKLSLKKVKYQLEIEQVSKQKFKIIRELSPEEKAEIRLYSDCKRLLETAIYITLSETQEPKCIRGGIKDFFSMFHITNENYKYFTYDRLTDEKAEIIRRLEFGEDYDVSVKNMVLHQFTEDVNPILRRIVLDTFSKMEDESYLILNKHRMFGETIEIINESGEKSITNLKKEATKKEEETYITIKRQLMEREGYNEWSKVPYYTKGNIKNEICKSMGYDYSYYEYEIILNQDGLQRKVERENLPKVLEELNCSISHKLRTSKQGKLKTTEQSVKKDCIDGLITTNKSN